MSDQVTDWAEQSDMAIELLDDDGPSIASEDTVELMEFEPLPGDEVNGEGAGIDMLLDINLNVSVELGRTNMTIGEVLALRSSSIIELDKLAGEPVDILVNGTCIAHAEVVVVDEKFGVRVLEVVSRARRLASSLNVLSHATKSASS